MDSGVSSHTHILPQKFIEDIEKGHLGKAVAVAQVEGRRQVILRFNLEGLQTEESNPPGGKRFFTSAPLRFRMTPSFLEVIVKIS